MNQSPAQPNTPLISTQVQLQIIDDLVSQVEEQNRLYTSAQGFSKESAVASTNLEMGSTQAVEHEPNPEIPPEVESYMQRVEDHSQTDPQEIVITEDNDVKLAPYVPSTPVIVVPMTEELEKVAKRKNPNNSVKWLLTFAQKIMKMFPGEVIYKES